MKIAPDFTEARLYAKISEQIREAMAHAESTADHEMQRRILKVYLSFHKLLSFAEKEKKDLNGPITHCAYCGYPDPEVKAVNKEWSSDEVITFILTCRSCKREDWPGALKEELMKILK